MIEPPPFEAKHPVSDHPPTEVNIEFVNHASFILEYNGTRIINDPWLFGSAFNDGWDLICDYEFDVGRFGELQYVWVSHEHPDHFSPSTLKSIPEEFRERITFLFQSTKDHKVIEFCAGLGFQIQELPHEKRVILRNGLKVTCGNVPFFDSWILYGCNGLKILNINDCVVDGEGVASDIRKVTGTIDLLLTQFSYAGWKGNVADKRLRETSAASKLAVMQTQIRAFDPEWTIPFASFNYFSHEENRYLNDSINKPQDAVDAIAEAGSTPILLYPTDSWRVGDPWDNDRSLESYHPDYDLSVKPFHTSETVPEVELIKSANSYIGRIRSRNNRLLMRAIRRIPLTGFLGPLKILVYDLDAVYEFSFEEGLVLMDTHEIYDVKMHSSSLSYIFRFDWGYDTLMVNGRFEADMRNFNKMTKTFSLGTLNNTGRFINLRLLIDTTFLYAFARALRKFARRLKQV